MPHIVVVSGSNRAEAQSHRIGEIITSRLPQAGAEWGTTAEHLSLRDNPVPMWEEAKRDADNALWAERWKPVSEKLKAADGVVVITPEWHGMASPMIKNFLCCCDAGELAFKPGYMVAVSAGAGGAYPIAELRMSGAKNNYLHWLPDHLIVRKANDFEPGANNEAAPDWLVARMDHGLKILSAYAEAAKPLRTGVVDLGILRNGM